MSVYGLTLSSEYHAKSYKNTALIVIGLLTTHQRTITISQRLE